MKVRKKSGGKLCANKLPTVDFEKYGVMKPSEHEPRRLGVPSTMYTAGAVAHSADWKIPVAAMVKDATQGVKSGICRKPERGRPDL